MKENFRISIQYLQGSALTASRLANWLERIRRPQESERAFAQRLGISQRTLRRIYEGLDVNPDTLTAIANSGAHNLSVAEVFKLAGMIPPASVPDVPQELQELFDTLVSLRGTPIFQPLLRAIWAVIEVVMHRLDQPDNQD